jgi:hypothetical protein
VEGHCPAGGLQLGRLVSPLLLRGIRFSRLIMEIDVDNLQCSFK